MKKIFICLFAAIAVQVSAQSTNDVSVKFDWCFPTFSTVPAEVCIEQGGIYKWFEYDINIATCTVGETIEKVHVSTNDCGEDETTTLQLTVNKCSPEGAIPSMFTVGKNDDGSLRKVYFSKGNLQYRASNGTTYPNDGCLKHEVAGGGEAQGEWRFAEKQRDFVANMYANRGPSATQTNWQDLFCWGTSGYEEKTPFDLNTSESHYASKADIAGTNYDWGVYNAISNGGNEPGIWRTLTKDEWTYLTTKRNDAANKAGLATISYKDGSYTKYCAGLVLLPDNFVFPEGLSLRCYDRYSDIKYDNNTYTEIQWTEMEKAGAVFLPSAGYFTLSWGSYVANVNYQPSSTYGTPSYSDYQGFYWLSTYYGDDSNKYKAYQTKFKNSDYITFTTEVFSHGHAVRLVADVQ